MVRYLVDAAASRVRIEARTTLHPVVVETSKMRGHLDLDVDDDGAVMVPDGAEWLLEIPGAQLRSGNAMIDRETKRHVNWRRHPYLRGELVHPVADGHGPSSLGLCGDVFFHGVQRRVTGSVEVVPAEGASLAVRGAATFDVRDFGLKPPRLLLLKVEPEVTVSIDLRAVAQVG